MPNFGVLDQLVKVLKQEVMRSSHLGLFLKVVVVVALHALGAFCAMCHAAVDGAALVGDVAEAGNILVALLLAALMLDLLLA